MAISSKPTASPRRHQVVRGISESVQSLGCIPVPKEHRVVQVAWLPGPRVLCFEVAFTGVPEAKRVFTPLGLVLDPVDPDAVLVRYDASQPRWLHPGSALERGIVVTAQDMRHSRMLVRSRLAQT